MRKQKSVDDLAREEQALQHKLKQLKADKLKAQKKHDDRRRTLAGAAVLNHAQNDADFRETLAVILDEALSKPEERDYFKDFLATPTAVEPQAASSPALDQPRP